MKEKNYSFVGEIYHRDYLAVGSITGIEVSLVADKEAYLALVEHLIITPGKIVDEGNGFLYIHRHSNYREANTFMSGIISITYKYGKIITQKSILGGT